MIKKSLNCTKLVSSYSISAKQLTTPKLTSGHSTCRRRCRSTSRGCSTRTAGRGRRCRPRRRRRATGTTRSTPAWPRSRPPDMTSAGFRARHTILCMMGKIYMDYRDLHSVKSSKYSSISQLVGFSLERKTSISSEFRHNTWFFILSFAAGENQTPHCHLQRRKAKTASDPSTRTQPWPGESWTTR